MAEILLPKKKEVDYAQVRDERACREKRVEKEIEEN